MQRSLDQGFRSIKIKAGATTLAQDMASVGALRQMIGAGIALMLDFNQSLGPMGKRYCWTGRFTGRQRAGPMRFF